MCGYIYIYIGGRLAIQITPMGALGEKSLRNTEIAYNERHHLVISS